MNIAHPVTQSILAGRTVTGPVAARIRIDGEDYINFFGSGYLALARIPEIRRAVECLLAEGAPFARAVPPPLGSIDPVFDACERAAAEACGAEASVYFASGYLIGSVGLASLGERIGRLLIDEHAHYSLKDAAKLTGLPTSTFRHCDAQSLAAALSQSRSPSGRPVVMTDGVFATTGRIPPLAEYAAILASYDGWLFVDEAHSFGVVGEHGRGAAEYCGLVSHATIGATLSKAYCAQGAIVGCSADVARRLRWTPPIRGASAGSPLSAVAATASLNYVAKHPELRVNLHALTQYFRARLRSIGLDTLDSPAPIVSFQLPTRAEMLALQRRLFERGLHVQYSTYIGSGAEGTIRCAVFADHTREDIDALISALR